MAVATTKTTTTTSLDLRGFYERTYDRLVDAFSPRDLLSRNPVSRGMAVWTAVILALVLLVSYLTG